MEGAREREREGQGLSKGGREGGRKGDIWLSGIFLLGEKTSSGNLCRNQDVYRHDQCLIYCCEDGLSCRHRVKPPLTQYVVKLNFSEKWFINHLFPKCSLKPPFIQHSV